MPARSRLYRAFRIRSQPQHAPLSFRSQRLLNPDGDINVVRLGGADPPFHDLYHGLLVIPWTMFFGLLGLVYLVTNTLFALAYLAGGDGIANARPGSFVDAFFFSVQTMATIGYGAMYPSTVYANILVTAEAWVGLLGVALGTGLMFARVSRPTARVMFSKVAVVSQQDGITTLMFRAANQRQNRIYEAQMRLTFVRDELSQEGAFMRRFYDLKLKRSQTPIFFLTWTVMHSIDEESPLYGLSPEDLVECNAEVIITMMGLDETFSQTIHTRHSYIASEIFWGSRFVDILVRLPDGRRGIDYARFHDVIPELEV